MRENRENKQSKKAHSPSFTVQDEIRRDRRIRRTGHIRRARSITQSLVTAALCIIICALLIVAVVMAVTRAETVTVSGNQRYSDTEILEAADISGDILPLLRENAVYKRIAASCPYIDSIQLRKNYPSTVEIIVSETEPVYVTVTRDRQLSLDRELRVMDYIDRAEGLILLLLPDIKTAVEGSRIVFTEYASDTFVTEMLTAFLEGEATLSFSMLDLRDRYNLAAIVDENTKILFGDYRNIDVKLAMAKKILTDAMDKQSARTLIDVSEPSRASVLFDYNGEF